MKTEEIMESLISFFSVAIVFLTVIAIIFTIFCKKFTWWGPAGGEKKRPAGGNCKVRNSFP